MNDWLLPLLKLPLFWGIVCGAFSILVTLPRSSKPRKKFGLLLGAISLGCLLASLPWLDDISASIVFWLMAAVTVVAAVATITVRSPIYSAIWFALSLLGTAGLFIFQGAQFLGVATIVVYAGAIVVTFLFVVMLAQPDGHSSYDRITWSGFTKPLAVLAAATLVGITTFAVSQNSLPVSEAKNARAKAMQSDDVLAANHMARLGTELFGKHLIAVELAGTLLMVALVGSVAIVLNERKAESATEEHSDG